MKLPMPGLRSIGLASLIGITSLAVGATTSYFLVPIYLLAMGWLLVGWPLNAGHSLKTRLIERPNSKAEEPSEPVTVLEPVQIPENTVSDKDPASKSRSKSRARGSRSRSKPKVEAPQPRLAATWVQVAPGKFVRVELPETESIKADVESTLERNSVGEQPLDPLSPHPEPVLPDDSPPIPVLETESFVPLDSISPWSPVDSVGGFANPDHEESHPFPPGSLQEDPTKETSWLEPSALLEDSQHEIVEQPTEWSDQAGTLEVEPPVPDLVGDQDSLALASDAISPKRLKARYVDAGVLRSARISIVTRPASRRSAGRIGSSPRVILTRA